MLLCEMDAMYSECCLPLLLPGIPQYNQGRGLYLCKEDLRGLRVLYEEERRSDLLQIQTTIGMQMEYDHFDLSSALALRDNIDDRALFR